MKPAWRRVRAVALVGAVTSLLVMGQAAAAPGGSQWLFAGGDRANTRDAASETKISPATVANLTVKWSLTTGGDVSATPAVDDTNVYVPDWAGNLYAVNRDTGAVVWQSSIPGFTSVPGDKARTTPAVADGKLIVGTQGSPGGGGRVLAVDKDTGQLLWSTQVDTHPFAVVTQSPTVFNGVVYVGVSSLEEGAAGLVPNYECCTFRGSMLALDLATGAILWKTYTVPDGYTGGSVWGSSPAVDPKRNSVYIATGNNYTVPDGVLDCVAAAGDDADAKAACLPADDLFDSIVALDLGTGAVRWATRAVPYDAWTWGCIPFLDAGENCPDPAGPDYDFGQAPALFKVRTGPGRPQELLGAGQKSGQYWALDPDTGAVVWETNTGPGGISGGLQWGSAVDGTRVYTANANSQQKQWVLPDGTTTTGGLWSALDASTGAVLWQRPTPDGGGASGPVTTANGVVFGCSLDPQGHMYALDAATGNILWSFASGGSCLSGAAIANGSVYWGSGYSNIGIGTPNNKLYAFTLG